MAEALAAQGHQVTILSPCEQPGQHQGVAFLPISLAQQYLPSNPVDAVIISRAVDACAIPTPGTTVKVLWCHDLALKRQRQQLAGVLHGIDAIYAPSRFHCDQIRQVHPLVQDWPEVVQTRNGLDLAAFAGLERLERDPWKLVYGSRPERGLAQALDLMAELARRQQPWTLHVSSYDNTPPQLVPLYEHLWGRCRALPNVVLHGPLKQADWRQHLATARALLYPGVSDGFREISCLVALEAQACGTPVLAAAKGALPESIHPDAGILLGDETTDVTTPAYRQALCDALTRLTDDAAWARMSAAGRAHGATLGWDGVAAQWAADIMARIARRNASAARVRAHLVRSGDREAAEGM